MTTRRSTLFVALVAITTLAFASGCATGLGTDDPLPSWDDGTAKTAILDFVAAVTEEDGPDFVEPARRIATFDNDGTLWVEYPMYTQVLFALDRVRALAPDHPEWKTTQPFKAVLEGDRE